METNEQLELAYDFLRYTGENLFLTGKAGTGKTTFLRNLKQMSPKRMIVVAPTGVAAINAGGVTIHSFFQLPFGPYVPGKEKVERSGEKTFVHKFSKEKINILKSLDLLVIDEVSMVRADLLDALSDVLCRYRNRDKPFGGVQLLLIGDLQQLAPVVKEEEWNLLRNYYKSPFFFNSLALQQTSYYSIELTHVYRQTDEEFIRLLNKVRDYQADEATLQALNRRYLPDFKPAKEENYITLTTHNAQAQLINGGKLEALPGKSFSYLAEVEGEFPAYSFPTDERLILKKGAQVMFVKNDSSSEKKYYNGKIGQVTDITSERIVVSCPGDPSPIRVEREEWTNTKYTVDPDTREIIERVEGTFRQYPLKTAWAITIHKSQGLTFEHAIIDASAAFSHGQVYVALSRCKTLEGLVLSSPLKPETVIHDQTVSSFTEQVEKNQPGKEELERSRRMYFMELLAEQFDFQLLGRRLGQTAYVLNTHLASFYPDLIRRYYKVKEEFAKEVVSVGNKFQEQLCRLVLEKEDYEQDPAIKDRIAKGVEYFEEKIGVSVEALFKDTRPESDNKEVRKAVNDALGRLQTELEVKLRTLAITRQGFTVKGYLETRAKAVMEKPALKAVKQSEKVEISADILHPVLYEWLREWRKEEAARLNLPAYMILQQKALLGVCNFLPVSQKELLKIPGIGKGVVEKHGRALLEIVDKYRLEMRDIPEKA